LMLVFRSCVSRVAATGTRNPNGLQQELELPIILRPVNK
jgi:hypothetical protein